MLSLAYPFAQRYRGRCSGVMMSMPSAVSHSCMCRLQAARPEVWKFLLGVYPAASTTEQRRALRGVKAAEYAQLKQQWQTISRPQAQRFAKWREVCTLPWSSRCLQHYLNAKLSQHGCCSISVPPCNDCRRFAKPRGHCMVETLTALF